jgi:hypothetical protein
MDRGATCFPFRVRLRAPPEDLFALSQSEANVRTEEQNITIDASLYLSTKEIDEECPALFFHSAAIMHSASYLAENSGALRQDWPRIPLPDSRDLLFHSADLGEKIVALFDTEHGFAGVTDGKLEKPINTIGVISRVGGGQLQTDEDESDGKRSELRITAGWGHGGKGGITMPGKGKVIQRDYTVTERHAIDEGASRLGLSAEEILIHLGGSTFDVYLNDVAYWRNIPSRVWEYTIGGYQVIKKWLSYREHKLLGRPLTTDEAREVMNMARRIASILLLEPALDANYQAVKAATYSWPRVTE